MFEVTPFEEDTLSYQEAMAAYQAGLYWQMLQKSPDSFKVPENLNQYYEEMGASIYGDSFKSTAQIQRSVNTVIFEAQQLPETFKLNEGGSAPVLPWAHQALTAETAVRDIIHGGKRKVYLFDPVGAGKTLQALSIFFKLKNLGLAQRLVLFAPALVFEDWVREIKKFTDDAPYILRHYKDCQKLLEADASVILIDERSRAKNPTFGSGSGTNYREDFEAALKGLFKKPDTVVCFDEVQNTTWQIKDAYADIGSEENITPITLLLTATPMSNSFGNLHQYDFNTHIFAGLCAYYKKEEHAVQAVLWWLNFATELSEFIMRHPGALSLRIPNYQLTYDMVSFRDTEASEEAVASDSVEPSMLLTQKGISDASEKIKALEKQRQEYLELETFREKLLERIKGAPKGSSVLVVFSSEKDLTKAKKFLVKELPDHQKRNLVDLSRQKQKEKGVDKSFPEAEEVARIYLVSLRKALGFNLQLSKLYTAIFFGGTPHIHLFKQAVGRLVRPWPASLYQDGLTVNIYVITHEAYKLEMEKIIVAFDKMQALMHLMRLSPLSSFVDVLKCSFPALKDDDIQKAIKSKLESMIRKLKRAVKIAENAQKGFFDRLGSFSILLDNPFLLGDFILFKSGGYEAEFNAIHDLVHKRFKSALSALIKTINIQFLSNFEESTLKEVMSLAYKLNYFGFFVDHIFSVVLGNVTQDVVPFCEWFFDDDLYSRLHRKEKHEQLICEISALNEVEFSSSGESESSSEEEEMLEEELTEDGEHSSNYSEPESETDAAAGGEEARYNPRFYVGRSGQATPGSTNHPDGPRKRTCRLGGSSD